jgi:beta-N-acetylhexosaminidase
MKDIDRLTLEEKIGQLFWLGFQGPSLDTATRGFVENIRPGGYVLSQRNIESFDQICGLVRNLKEDPGLPALVGIHQEGGAADRLKQLFAPLPAMRNVAMEGVGSVRALARIMATQLEICGFTHRLFPGARSARFRIGDARSHTFIEPWRSYKPGQSICGRTERMWNSSVWQALSGFG